jgi:hypothetical protein
MKNSLLAVAAFFAFSFRLQAQVDLPAPSPKAQVMQTVGLTDITIDYSSPGVKGRVIWGGLQAYDSLWRAGANAATKVTFSRDVTVEGREIKAGSYSLFIIPAKTGAWTIILNSDPSASTGEYQQSKDVIRISAAPSAVPFRERLAYQVTDFTDSTATISMEWEKVRVAFPIILATHQQALNSIQKTLGGTWRNYNAAARYMMDHADLETAMKYADQSLSLSDEWYNNWTKAQILDKQNKTSEALMYARKSKALGDKNPDGFFYKSNVEKALVDWSGK